MKLNSGLVRRSIKLSAAACLLFAAITLPHSDTYAAVPKMDSIRVALFIESAKYKLNTQAVTLSTEGGLSVGNREPASSTTVLTFTGAQTVRFALDQYSVKLLETADIAQAKALQQSLKDGSFSAWIFKTANLGKTVYQVAIGNFATREAAAAAQALALAKAPLPAGAPVPFIAGPLYLNAGSYPAEADALAQQTALAQAGIASDLVYQADPAGASVYSVWVGGASDPQQLETVKQQAAAVPGLALLPVEPNTPYLLKRIDVTAGDGAAAVPFYAFNPNGQKVWAAPLQGKLTVKEKSRAYRGGVELSQFGGKLAVVNELPFEQYLYSVVSGEMGRNWPQEALKAQAVAARSYALQGGVKYQIAHVTDTTLDQVYNGNEYEEVIKAVDATAGEVLVNGAGTLISAVFSSNSGGITAEGTEVWGSASESLKSAASPDDIAAKGKPVWLRVAKPDGTAAGWVHSGYLRATGGKNAIGLQIYAATENAVNIRTSPSSDNAKSPSVGQLKTGEPVVAFGQAVENNEYNWLVGPVPAAQLDDKVLAALPVQGATALQTLEVAGRGPSGRVTVLKANGQVVKVPYPDSFRSLLGGLNSTLFDIEETGRYTIGGANGSTRSLPEAQGPLFAVQGSGASAAAPSQFFILNGSGHVRMATSDAQFVFNGKGYGHGLGLSQWGARGMAEQGSDYLKILSAYYTGTTIAKG